MYSCNPAFHAQIWMAMISRVASPYWSYGQDEVELAAPTFLTLSEMVKADFSVLRGAHSSEF